MATASKTWPTITDPEWNDIAFQLEGIAELIRAYIESDGNTTHDLQRKYGDPVSASLILAARKFTKRA